MSKGPRDITHSSDTLHDVPRYAGYGSGVFRRRIRLRQFEGGVSAELEDSSHGFKTKLQHDGHVVTAVQAEAIRYPMTTCPGALEPLQRFVGLPLNMTAAEIANQINPRQQCTHLFDLTVLAYGQLQREESQRVYDMQMADEAGSVSDLEVFCNGEKVLSWRVQQWQLQAPAAVAEKTLSTGFSRWMEALYGDDEQQKEYAWLAQKAYLVAQARIYDVNKLAGTRRFMDPKMTDICHTYSKSQRASAIHTENNFIDFSEAPEQLLKFVGATE